MSQIVIEEPPEIRVKPEIIADAQSLVREIYFSKMLSKSVLNEFELREYENFIEQFITEDDEPVDNIFSEKQQKLLTHTLYSSWKPFDENGNPRLFFATANVGLYARLNPKIKAIVPDVLVSLDVAVPKNPHEKRHRSYMVWEFGKPPDIVVEIVSNEIGGELDEKLDKYSRIGIDYYVVFDPEYFLSNDRLLVYQRDLENGYRLREDFRLPGTGLNLMLWQGTFEEWSDTEWLRWTDANGEMLLTADEKNQKLDEKNQKLTEKLRELGVDPTQI